MDAGTGIDPATVEMRLNGEVVAADYITGTGQLLYLPEEPPAGGTYSVTVSAADVVGNGGSASATFTVEATYRVYLPVVLRSYRLAERGPSPLLGRGGRFSAQQAIGADRPIVAVSVTDPACHREHQRGRYAWVWRRLHSWPLACSL